MLLSVQMGIGFVRAAVARAILERISGLEPSSETTAQRYLKLVTVPSFCPYTFISLCNPLALFVIRLVFSLLIPILHVYLFSEPFSSAAIHLDCTKSCSLVIELLNGAN